MRRILGLMLVVISMYSSGSASAFYFQNQPTQLKDNRPTVEDSVGLKINDISIKVEYADTPSKRQLGLMYRRSLCEDCGMLFKFDTLTIGSIWMKNTYIPLDLAYISSDGEIVDIRQLQPHDLTPVISSQKVRYALEMNKGWFASNDIREGDVVTNLP